MESVPVFAQGREKSRKRFRWGSFRAHEHCALLSSAVQIPRFATLMFSSANNPVLLAAVYPRALQRIRH
jgi:hypothetical protein